VEREGGGEIEQGLGMMVGGDGSVRVSLVDQGCCCHAAAQGAGGQPTGSEHTRNGPPQNHDVRNL
jgi:hypothetical protein